VNTEKRAESQGINQEVTQRIEQEKRLQELEKMIHQRKNTAVVPPAAAAPAGPALEPELSPADYKYVRVESLDELKERVRRVCTYIDQKEEDVHNKLAFPYRLALVLGATAFFLAMVVSLFSAQPVMRTAKLSIGSFFIFAFLGWLVGLVTNYFSARNAGDPVPDADKGRHVDFRADLENELEEFKKGKVMVDKNGWPPQPPAPPPPPAEPTTDEKEATIRQVIEQVAKDAPDKVAAVIKGVLSKGEK
jgi:hypothetical protein